MDNRPESIYEELLHEAKCARSKEDRTKIVDRATLVLKEGKLTVEQFREINRIANYYRERISLLTNRITALTAVKADKNHIKRKTDLLEGFLWDVRRVTSYFSLCDIMESALTMIYERRISKEEYNQIIGEATIAAELKGWRRIPASFNFPHY